MPEVALPAGAAARGATALRTGDLFMAARRLTRMVSLAALLIAWAVPTAASAAPPSRGPSQPAVLSSDLDGGSGSTVGPGGDLYVTEGATGTIWRVDPRTGKMTMHADCLPPAVVAIGGAIDVAFRGGTAYALVTLVSFDGTGDVVGLYRIDGPHTCTVVADIGRFSLDNPPEDTDFFVATGVQYALEKFRDGFLVTDGHHNRVLRVDVDGGVSELMTFDNIVPTGLDVRGNTVYMAQAGPVPHRPEDGRVVSFRAGSSVVTEVAAGGPLLVDVELGRGRTVLALAQGDFPEGAPGGAPALPGTGQLLRVAADGSFTVVADGLDRPTSVEVVRNTAYVVTLPGDILVIENVAAPPYGRKR